MLSRWFLRRGALLAPVASLAAGEVKAPVHQQGFRATFEPLIAVIQTAIVHKYYEIGFKGNNLNSAPARKD